MTFMRSRCCLAGMLAVLSIARTAVAAPDRIAVDDSYGRGVHAYFSGNLAEAEQQLSQAMGADPNDPRPCYFRALCLLRQGRSDEARSDIMIGSALEARSPGSYPVGKSLERVQGGDRLMLEQYRWRARAAKAVGGRPDYRAANRANVAVRTDVGALRQKISVPLDRLIQPVSLTELANDSAELATPAPANVAQASSDDPFADDPRAVPAGKLPAGKLLGILGRAIVESAPVPELGRLREQIPGLPAPAEDGPADEAGSANDPFGSNATAAPDDEDPFGMPAPAADPADSSPAKDKDQPAEAADEDPFG